MAKLDGVPVLLSVDQVVDVLGISKSFAYQLIRAGRLSASRCGKRAVLRVSTDSVRKFLKENTVEVPGG